MVGGFCHDLCDVKSFEVPGSPFFLSWERSSWAPCVSPYPINWSSCLQESAGTQLVASSMPCQSFRHFPFLCRGHFSALPLTLLQNGLCVWFFWFFSFWRPPINFSPFTQAPNLCDICQPGSVASIFCSLAGAEKLDSTLNLGMQEPQLNIVGSYGGRAQTLDLVFLDSNPRSATCKLCDLGFIANYSCPSSLICTMKINGCTCFNLLLCRVFIHMKPLEYYLLPIRHFMC